jgi:hypothetical protein
MNGYQITHVNHSSLLIDSHGKVLLTDPWYYDNAFSGWAPYPQPDAELVNMMTRLEKKVDIIVISHAHDDHIDGYFLNALKNSARIAYPEGAGPGLKLRLSSYGFDSNSLIPIGPKPIEVDGFSISCIHGNALSKEDFVFFIRTSSMSIVHSNDNWQQYSEEICEYLTGLFAETSIERRYLFSQVGVADSFPLYYRGITRHEKQRLIKDKCRRMLDAIEANREKLKIGHSYAYANQSLFEINNLESIDPYLIRDREISQHTSRIQQLVPSCTIGKDGVICNPCRYIPLIKSRLEKFGEEYTIYALNHKSYTPSCLSVSFTCDQYCNTSHLDGVNSVIISTSLHQWNRILGGAINLESVITGGLGFIYKPPSYSMRIEYSILVDWAYSFQSKIRARQLFI